MVKTLESAQLLFAKYYQKNFYIQSPIEFYIIQSVHRNFVLHSNESRLKVLFHILPIIFSVCYWRFIAFRSNTYPKINSTVVLLIRVVGNITHARINIYTLIKIKVLIVCQEWMISPPVSCFFT